MITDKILKISIFLAALGIGLGALGAHTLKELLSESKLDSFETGIRYQMFHSLSLITLVLNKEKFNNNLNLILIFMILGVLLFSFSIYALCFNNLINYSLSFLGPITPIGGLLLISSWIILIFSVKK
tara:strand:+ start:432 stop:812 length:381 start_codon:yes stop_codon:yes gene_type:complete